MKVTGTGPGSTDRTRDVHGTAGANALEGTREKSKRSRLDNIEHTHHDKVDISSRAKDAAHAKELAKSAPDIDEAKVERLKRALHAGEYKVSADKIADKLVDEHLFSSV